MEIDQNHVDKRILGGGFAVQRLNKHDFSPATVSILFQHVSIYFCFLPRDPNAKFIDSSSLVSFISLHVTTWRKRQVWWLMFYLAVLFLPSSWLSDKIITFQISKHLPLNHDHVGLWVCLNHLVKPSKSSIFQPAIPWSPSVISIHPGRLTAGTYKSPMKRKENDHLPNLYEDMFQPLIFQGVKNRKNLCYLP